MDHTEATLSPFSDKNSNLLAARRWVNVYDINAKPMEVDYSNDIDKLLCLSKIYTWLYHRFHWASIFSTKNNSDIIIVEANKNINNVRLSNNEMLKLIKDFENTFTGNMYCINYVRSTTSLDCFIITIEKKTNDETNLKISKSYTTIQNFISIKDETNVFTITKEYLLDSDALLIEKRDYNDKGHNVFLIKCGKREFFLRLNEIKNVNKLFNYYNKIQKCRQL